MLFKRGPTAAQAAAIHLPDESADYHRDGQAPLTEAEGAFDERGSIASVARRAQDAAKNMLNAGYAALTAPGEDLSQDTRELLTPVGTQIQRAGAAVKLESMSHATIVVTLAVVYFSAFVSLLLAIILIALNSAEDLTLNAALVSFGLDGFTRTLATLIVALLFFFFPFRVMRHTMKTGSPILPEQGLLILFLLLIMITPGFSLYSPYLFWYQYHLSLDFTNARGGLVPNFSAGEVFSVFFFTRSTDQATGVIVTGIFTIIILVFGMLYFGLTVYFFGKAHAAKQPRSDVEAQQDHDDDDNSRTMTCAQLLCNCISTYKALALEANKRLIVLTAVYLVLFITLISVYDFLPSQVPFVGMISVFKVCPQSGGEDSQNRTNCDPSLLEGVPFARAMSVTAQFVMECIIVMYLRRITLRTKRNLTKMPYESNRSKHLGFRYFNSNKRMTFFFILLVSIIVVSVAGSTFDIFVVIRDPATGTFTRKYSPLSQVGINYYKLGFGPFYLLLACLLFALAVAYLPPDSVPGPAGFCCGGHTVVTERDLDHPSYILREQDVLLLRRSRDEAREKMLQERKRRRRQAQFVNYSNVTRDKRANLTSLSRRPLLVQEEQVPTPEQVQELDAANDPQVARQAQDPSLVADGDHTDEHDDDDQRDVDSTNAAGQQQREGEPAISGTEKFRRFFDPGHLGMRVTTDKFAEQYAKLAALLHPKAHLSSHDSMSSLANASISLIAEQMNANLFCIETEVLLLNFAFMAYTMGSFKDEAPLTNEEKQALIGKDSRYRLVSHLENALTDIQCCVFVDTETDKVFVAFRGTSTSKNIWQDLDYFQIPHPASKDVDPLIRRPDDLVAKAAAMRDPMVHRGFFLAYESLSDAVMAVVSDVVEAMTNGCVVFVCGHSLGGALATHFALDLGIKYKLVESNIKGLQVSTFGSPRVGNFSYVCRHRRIVPTTHRFCIGGDPVPKLPPARPFSEFTKWGYHHIGVEILLDVERVNLLLGPLFIERQLQHGWGGYVPGNHITGSYVLALALWCARVHPTYVPDWWLPVVNHVLKTERHRLKRIIENKPALSPSVVEQLNKEGAVMWTDDSRALRNRGCDTAMGAPESSTKHDAGRVARQLSTSTLIRRNPDTESVTAVELALASCGVLFERRKRAEVLFAKGFTSANKLAHIHMEDLARLKEGQDKELFDEDFIKLLMQSISINRCRECDYAPLVCPSCAERQLDMT